jgi:hypothetical protein
MPTLVNHIKKSKTRPCRHRRRRQICPARCQHVLLLPPVADPPYTSPPLADPPRTLPPRPPATAEPRIRHGPHPPATAKPLIRTRYRAADLAACSPARWQRLDPLRCTSGAPARCCGRTSARGLPVLALCAHRIRVVALQC